MGKGGGTQTTTTEVKLPPAIEKAAEENLAIANEVAAIGYTPYNQGTVAGLGSYDPYFDNTQAAASAFGLSAADPRAMLPPEQSFGGGFSGWSALPTYEAALAGIPDPVRGAIESFIMNSETGAPPNNPAVPTPTWQFGGDNVGGSLTGQGYRNSSLWGNRGGRSGRDWQDYDRYVDADTALYGVDHSN
jgi:hypothetical protein